MNRGLDLRRKESDDKKGQESRGRGKGVGRFEKPRVVPRTVFLMISWRIRVVTPQYHKPY